MRAWIFAGLFLVECAHTESAPPPQKVVSWKDARQGVLSEDVEDEPAAEPIAASSAAAEIKSDIQRHEAEIRRCYEIGLAAERVLQGRVNVRFVISPTGHVSESQVADSTIRHQQTERCITDKVRGWKFAAPQNGKPVVVTYPFSLKMAPPK